MKIYGTMRLLSWSKFKGRKINPCPHATPRFIVGDKLENLIVYHRRDTHLLLQQRRGNPQDEIFARYVLVLCHGRPFFSPPNGGESPN